MRQTQNPLCVFGRMCHHRKLCFFARAGRRTLRRLKATDVGCNFLTHLREDYWFIKTCYIVWWWIFRSRFCCWGWQKVSMKRISAETVLILLCYDVSMLVYPALAMYSYSLPYDTLLTRLNTFILHGTIISYGHIIWFWNTQELVTSVNVLRDQVCVCTSSNLSHLPWSM